MEKERDDSGNGGGGEESFADLFEKSHVDAGRLSPGEKIEARVVKIGAEWVFLDLGRKGEGVLSRKEFTAPDGSTTVREGDLVRAYFVSADGGDFLFTTKIGGGAAGAAQLEDAWQTGIPVEGYVEKEVKGGYEVKLAGGARAFCPYSQAGLPRARGVEALLGERLAFRVTSYGERGRNIVLSRRALLEEEQKAKKEALRGTLAEGMTVRGTVTSVREFGAFVDVGGIEGLLPVSEIGWERIGDARDVLAPGQEVDLVITGLDWERERFAFSLKKTLSDPWEAVASRLSVGSVVAGKVARLTPFGAFVNLAPGIDGLLHVSKLGRGKKVRHPGEVVREGEAVEVRVEGIDVERKRITLGLAGAEGEEPSEEAAADYRAYLDRPAAPSASLGEALAAKLAEKSRKRGSR